MSKLEHDRRFPGESPEYRTARNALLQAEHELRQKVEAVAALRRELPLGGKVSQDYAFEEVSVDSENVREVKLSELFSAGKTGSLIAYSFMYGPQWEKPCPSCTTITDTFNGYAHHVHDRVDFVVIAKAPPAKLRALAKGRGWSNIRYLSSHKNSYNVDYHAQPDDKPESQHPICNVFTKRDDGVYHTWASELLFVPWPAHPRHADMFWPLWNLFDLTPEGRGSDWGPKLSYDE